MAETIALAAGPGLLVLWTFILFVRPLFRIFKGYFTFRATVAGGREVSGRVISSSYLREVKGNGTVPITMKVEFENFSGAAVQTSFHTSDTRPAERRFDSGRTVRIQLNPGAPPGRQIMIVGSQATLNPKVLLPFLLVFLAWLAGLAWVFDIIWRGAGGNLDALLSHLPESGEWQGSGLIFLATLIFVGALFKILGASFSRKNDTRLRFYGRQAPARITGVERTGVKVNNQPQVMFHYEFTTHDGRKVSGSERNIIDILDIGKVHDIKEKEILYLPDDPSVSAWLENVNQDPSSGVTGILKGVFYLMFFIFTCIYLGQLLYFLWPGQPVSGI
ncbi:MAG: hypothetical protein HS115_18445 [Spirochaetales bacterium]|nr:hypothetical protein [Spirochaetales bacterium]